MFTGLIDDVGTIDRASTTDAGREFRVRCRYGDLEDGESIAVNGVCLTVRERGEGWFTCAAVVTTLGRTAIADWREGMRVNLERALQAGDRMGGHIVQGHVDGVGRVLSVRRREDALLIDVALPEELSDLVVPFGSITVDGVSLTVNDLPAAGVVQLSIIEYTLRHTALGDLAEGRAVHVEADVVGKYVKRLMEPYLKGEPSTLAARRYASPAERRATSDER